MSGKTFDAPAATPCPAPAPDAAAAAAPVPAAAGAVANSSSPLVSGPAAHERCARDQRRIFGQLGDRKRCYVSGDGPDRGYSLSSVYHREYRV